MYQFEDLVNLSRHVSLQIVPDLVFTGPTGNDPANARYFRLVEKLENITHEILNSVLITTSGNMKENSNILAS